jgi:hypothetical protein
MKNDLFVKKEAAPLHDEAKSKVYYHGTQSEASGQKIMSEGIQPREILMPDKAKSRAQLAPVPNRVYLTDQFSYAVTYALGGGILGTKYLKFLKDKDPYGYIFEIDGADLTEDTVPDEDSIGSIMHYMLEHRNDLRILKNLENTPERYPGQKASIERGIREYTGVQPINQPGVPPSVLDNLSYITKYLTERQKIHLDEVGTQAQVGKKLQKYLTPETVQWMLNHGAHIAYKGPVFPSRVWKVDKKAAIMIGGPVENWAKLIQIEKTASEDDLLNIFTIKTAGTSDLLTTNNTKTQKPYQPSLVTDKNTKMQKGVSKGYLTGIMHLMPADLAGYGNVCPCYSSECRKMCLNTAGQWVNSPRIQDSRRLKTELYFKDRKQFMEDLRKSIKSLIRKAEKENLTPAIRLNGTSDLPQMAMQMAKEFPEVQFYDYTKIPRPWDRQLPNYHITFSRSEVNEKDAIDALKHGIDVAVVFNIKKGDNLPSSWRGFPVIDGDKHDLRFLDKLEGKGPFVVGLRAKGKARGKGRGDETGFVVDPEPKDLIQIKTAAQKWYHGTSKENADKILKQGYLHPGMMSKYIEDAPREDAIYIADYEIAQAYASDQPDGVVLEVAVPDPGNLLPDEDSIWEALKNGTIGSANPYVAGEVRKMWLQQEREEAETYELKVPQTFDEAWKIFSETVEGWYVEQSGELAERMKFMVEYIHKRKPNLAKEIIEASGKAAHIGPLKIVGLAKAATIKRAFTIEVPKGARDHFWQEPPAGNYEFWAFKDQPYLFPGEKITFTFDRNPVAEVPCAFVEEPGKSQCQQTGKYKEHFKIYWNPQQFTDLRKFHSPKERTLN